MEEIKISTNLANNLFNLLGTLSKLPEGVTVANVEQMRGELFRVLRESQLPSPEEK